MVTAFEFDRYLEYPKEDAYRIHQDEKNYSFLKIFLIIFSVIAGFILLTTFFDGNIDYDSYAYFVSFSASLLLRLLYSRIFTREKIRRQLYILIVASLIAFLASDMLSSVFDKGDAAAEREKITKTEKTKNGGDITINANTEEEGASGVIFLFALLMIMLRFPKSDIVQLYSLVIGLPLLTDLIFFGNFNILSKLPSVITAGLCFVISYSTEIKRQKKFYRQYDSYYKRHSESVRMKKELDYAREIQLSMLPESVKSIGDLHIAATSIPANEVGGDYYDYFRISDTKTGIFICDVSGHGVASALLLSGLRSCMHLVLEDTSNPKEIFIKLNRMIRKTQNRKMFVTAVFAVIDSANNKCTMFNAGHLPPYKISGDSNELFKIKRHGITLGATDNFINSDEDNLVTFDFKKGDRLLLYTDGIIEAMNSRKDEYGFERLENYLYAHAESSPSELLDRLVKDVNVFTGDSEKIDDISILVLSRK
ncbi:MAG: serine/threonine-protein phosphatase [Ignavibacteria bacterium]|jgi:serine phosphatase RsbU (regulator of sigma subunit)|nr:serine/threonine-protein phosphatase [Ignavibacteria bacterium]